MPALEQIDGHEDGEQVHVRRVELEIHVCRAEVVAGRHHSDHEEGHPHCVEEGVGGACASARVGLTSFCSRKFLSQVEDSRPEAFISFDPDRLQFSPDGHVLLDVGDEAEEETKEHVAHIAQNVVPHGILLQKLSFLENGRIKLYAWCIIPLLKIPGFRQAKLKKQWSTLPSILHLRAYCNNTLENTPPEYRDNFPSRNFATRGPRAEGCKIPIESNFEVRGWRIFRLILTRGSVLTFFSREGGIRNYTPNGWEVLTALNSIKLPLWKKECMGFISLSKSSSILIHINVKKSLFQKLALQSPVENTLSQGELERRQEVKNAVRKIVIIIISDFKRYINYDQCFQPTHL